MATKKIFLSYSRADSDYVAKLTQELKKLGQDVWVDNKIRSGQTWDETVEQNIRQSDVLVVVMSPTSVASSNVMDEVSFGIGLDKTISPILIENCEVPMRLARFQYVDFNDLGLEEGTRKLVSDINYNAKQEDSNHTVSGGISKKAVRIQKRRENSAISRNRIIYIGAAIVLIVVALFASGVISLEDDSDDFPTNMVENAATDEASWSNAKAIHTVKGYLDYSAKYSEKGKFLKEAGANLDSLLNTEGVVEYSEVSGDTKENKFFIYHSETGDKTRTPKIGEYIISITNNDVNTELLGTNNASGKTMKIDEIAKVLEVQNASGKVWCKISYNAE